ncbi:MAG: deoxyribodipyrimidine photo-lyase [Alphaproteobacteria bacterium]|nr:deoxyribodipyrimidine photo-lyase [Alphaproteobacteria bacterium]
MARIRRSAGPEHARPALVWFRHDLRLADNPALLAAIATGRPVLPVHVMEPPGASSLTPGAAARWWLHGSLAALGQDLAAHGASLLLLEGHAAEVLPDLVRQTGAASIHWNRCYEPAAIARDTALKASLRAMGLEVSSHNAALLFEPWTIRTGQDQPFKVFSPFWRACLAQGEPLAPLPAPRSINGFKNAPAGLTLAELRLLPVAPDWAGGLREAWSPGERAARARLACFLEDGLAGYAELRDRPDLPGSSRLSPHLHFGEIGPRQVWHAVRGRTIATGEEAGAQAFLRELGWREFSHHLLHQFPELPERSFRPEFDQFPWVPDATLLIAWQRGRTGYPLVDAGMRELWRTGWMHNRVRMIAASFLVKHLLQPWMAGAAWFMDTLVDADLANNSAGWQWVAGSGADAAPYFRVFNPVLQGERFDPDGNYVRRFVPELAALPASHIHKPWTAPPSMLAECGIRLGHHYPAPIVPLEAGRHRALSAYRSMTRESA